MVRQHVGGLLGTVGVHPLQRPAGAAVQFGPARAEQSVVDRVPDQRIAELVAAVLGVRHDQVRGEERMEQRFRVVVVLGDFGQQARREPPTEDGGGFQCGARPGGEGEVLDLLGIWQEVHPLMYRI